MYQLAQMWAEDDRQRNMKGFDDAIMSIMSNKYNIPSKHKIYYLMGKSATGKDSIYKRLVSEMQLKPILMSTTRPMRNGEVMDREYHFTNLGEFLNMQTANQIAEYRTYSIYDNDAYIGEWIYYTPRIELDTSECSRIGIGTIESYESLYDEYADKLVPIYIEVNDNERFLRAVEREKLNDQPNYHELCRRYLADDKDFSDIKLSLYNIYHKFTNDNIDDCVADIKQFIYEKEVTS